MPGVLFRITETVADLAVPVIHASWLRRRPARPTFDQAENPMKLNPTALRHWRAILGVCLALVVPATAIAQTYPEHPIRIIVGFAPGGSSDIVARIVAQKLSALVGQPVLVENKPGAGGMLGADFVAKAPGDGYTLLLAVSGHATGAAIMKNLPFDPVNDFAWVTMLTTYPMIIATRPLGTIKSLPDLIAQAKAQPGRLTYASAGVGTAHHLLGEWFSAQAGIDMIHIPFRGGTSPLVEVMGGRVDVMFETATVVLPHIQAGKLVALAVSSRQPVVFGPGVPTINQSVPGVDYQSWLGIAAPAATRPAVVERLNRELHKVLEQPDVRQRLAELGGGAAPTTPEAMRAEVQSQVTRWQKLVDSRHIEKQ
jgi:tripartite-type tricarboxylate transporter receptor subunit TctC